MSSRDRQLGRQAEGAVVRLKKASKHTLCVLHTNNQKSFLNGGTIDDCERVALWLCVGGVMLSVVRWLLLFSLMWLASAFLNILLLFRAHCSKQSKARQGANK